MTLSQITEFTQYTNYASFSVVALTSLWLFLIRTFNKYLLRKKHNFQADEIHLGIYEGIAIDHSRNRIAHVMGFQTSDYSASEITKSQQFSKATEDETSNFNRNPRVAVTLDNHEHSEISFEFYTNKEKQKCESSLIPFRQSKKEMYIELSAPNSAVKERISLLLLNENFSREQVIRIINSIPDSLPDVASVKLRALFDQATDLIFPEYETPEGFVLPHGHQKHIEEALMEIFCRQPGEKKKSGYALTTLRKYISDNKQDWEEEPKNRIINQM